MALTNDMIRQFARGVIADIARPRYEATEEHKAALLREAMRTAVSCYDDIQEDVRYSGYRVTKRVRDVLWAEVNQIAAEGYANETVARSELFYANMVADGEKRYSRVVCDGYVQQWSGTGWRDVRPAIPGDFATLPVAV